MRLSRLFTKTRREVPSDETSKNAQLLIRGGFINKEMAGVYSFLPLGFKVLENIIKIVKEEMEVLGSLELRMSTIQNKEVWEKTNRWDDTNVDVWFKSRLKNNTEIGFGWSHEEPITEMLKQHINSYHDLPIAVHQFQNKLRNEVRAKSGILRGREFVMKDMYFFARTEKENNQFYNQTIEAYKKVFERVGLGEDTYVTSASGGIFTDKFSHEFQTICDAGEDIIYVNEDKKIALNKEIFNKETLGQMRMKEEDFEEKKVAEVGNIFNFGTKKCEQMDLYYKDSDGEKKAVFLSSYGIGVTRLLGVIVEKFGNENEIVWPDSVSPYLYHLVEINSSDLKVKETAERIYRKLKEITLYDDRNVRAGEKFADADLIGIPYQVIVSEKNLAEGKLELKNRHTGEVSFTSEAELLK